MRGGWHVAFVALALFFGVLFVSPNVPIGRAPSEDESVFVYAARAIASGGMPYRDVWDHKPPAVYLLDALVGSNQWGIFAMQVIAIGCAAVLSHVALLKRFGALGALFGTLAWIVAVPRLLLEDGLQTNFAEFYALPLQFGAIALFAAEARRERPSWRTAALGVTGAAAFLVKPTLVGLWIAAVLVFLFYDLRARRWAQVAIRSSLGLAAAAVPLAVTGMWLLSGDALGDALDQVLGYNAAYSSSAPPLERLSAIGLGLRLTAPSGLAPLAGIGWMLALPRERSPLVVLSLVALPLELALGAAGRAYHYYFLAWLPAMAVLAAYCWAWQPLRSPRALMAITFGGCAVMSAVPSVLVGRLLATTDDGSSREAAAYVVGVTGPEERVLVWGSRTEILVLANRRSPTRFVYQYGALATRGYPSRVEELVADLERMRPTLIVDTSKDSFVTPPLDRRPFSTWESPEPLYEWPAETSHVLDFVSANYERIGRLRQSGWPVWRLRRP